MLVRQMVSLDDLVDDDDDADHRVQDRRRLSLRCHGMGASRARAPETHRVFFFRGSDAQRGIDTSSLHSFFLSFFGGLR
jgi:hypothetical protein